LERPLIIKSFEGGQKKLKQIAYNGSGLCVVALNKNLKLNTTLDRAITQNPCYVPFFFKYYVY